MKDFGESELNGLCRNGVVKSVQAGTVLITGAAATSGTATITAVDVNNALLIWLNYKSAYTGSEAGMGLIELTNSTTVTAKINSAVAADETFSFMVVEFYPGIIRSVQRGTVVIANGSASNTATVTAVNTAKAVLTFLGNQYDNNLNMASAWASLVLTNSTTITAARVNTTTQLTVGYQLVEFY